MRLPATNPRSAACSRAFTLLELVLAIAVCAVILAAINGAFWGALRLRNRTTQMLEESTGLQQALAILRRDLSGVVLPGGTFAGQFNTDASSLLTAAESGIRVTPDLHTNTGYLDDWSPWGDVQKVAYFLRTPTNQINADAGYDLFRVVTRNLNPALQDDPTEQYLTTGIERMQLSYYDGSTWRTTWNSTNELTILPRAVRVQLVMAARDPDPQADRSIRITRAPIEMVVPIRVRPDTNATQTATSGQASAQ